jgi:hypothetical protein
VREAGLPDAALTAAEFRRRHGTPTHGPGDDCHDGHDLHPEPGEEETVSSTLCFERKYAHVVETRPPVPLFPEHMLGRGADAVDDLARLLRGRSGAGATGGPPVALGAARRPARAGARIRTGGAGASAAEF